MKTSTSHPLRIDEITLPGGGRIGMTLCPGKKQRNAASGSWDRDIATDLCAIRDWGASAVVTLMEPHEFAEYQVPEIGEKVESLGIDWYLLPIRDGDVPDNAFETVWIYAGHRIRLLLRQGKRILIHCCGGLGRTGTIAARLMIELGFDPPVAVTVVRHVRPGAIETEAQKQYVFNTKPAPASDFADRVMGCLIGGAVGDGLGYEVEFSKLPAIRARFGAGGISQPVFHDGYLIVSDDTQMTLFTAEGLLRAGAPGGKVDLELAIEEIRAAYLDWLITQGASVEKRKPKGTLSSFKALRHRRDPGLTCLSALEAGGHGTIAKPINDSKGCGGVMRTAPLGLITSWSAETAFEAGAAAAALTHGHSSGFLSGGAMAMLVRLLLSGTDLANAVEATLAVLARYSGAEETVRAIKRGLEAAGVMSTDHEQVIRRLGEGWVGEEALSIALYSALVGKSFSETIAIAANHSGDSDSTASIAGQLYATWRGIADVPHAWVRRLDVFEPILVIANGLLGPDRTTALFCQLSAH